ncbi:MAG: methyltransferase domain-containing protein [Rhodobacteraceae bacterium]|nr:MAG: methyltransferase domain-containing protein [Paracoccaceae bacterium]
MTSLSTAETTDNAFLGGRLQILQPRRGYRAGVDPVLLAASVPARAGQSVLELGCGGGTALLCLGARVAGLHLTGVERQGAYAGLARENARRNGIKIAVIEADLDDLPPALRAQGFDHVIANPPFFSRAASSASADAGREGGRGESLPLARWLEVAAKRLRPGGHVTVIQRAERLPDLLAACAGRLGSLEILPLSPRQGRAARLVLLRGRKGGGAAFCLHAPVVLHRGERHARDGDDYTPMISDVLRNAAALPFGGQ